MNGHNDPCHKQYLDSKVVKMCAQEMRGGRDKSKLPTMVCECSNCFCVPCCWFVSFLVAMACQVLILTNVVRVIIKRIIAAAHADRIK